MDGGDGGAGGGVADGDEEERAFVFRALEDAGEERHGAWGVDEGGESGVAEGGKEEAGSESDAFVDVVVFAFLSVFEGVIEAEDGDEAGGGFEEWFMPVGSEGAEGFEPFIGEAVFVVLAFFGFGGFADLAFEVGVGDEDEAPGLLVGAGGGLGCGGDGGFDDVEGDGVRGEVADATAGAEEAEKRERPPAHLGFRQAGEGERQEFRLGHGSRASLTENS